MNVPVTDYTTLVFDCDGVVLNSNQVKTDAFYQAAMSANIDFLFICKWSEFEDWESWMYREGVASVYDIRSLR